MARLLLLLFVLLLGACDRRDGPAPAPSASAIAPVPAPVGLIAEILVGHPTRTWGSARPSLGGPAILLPRSVGGLVANGVGLPIRVAEEIDEGLPVLGALARAGQELELVVGVHVKDGARLVNVVTQGGDATFTARRAGVLTWLDRKATTREGRLSGLAVGVLDNYLLIGNRAGALPRLGPYVARSLSAREAPAEDVRIELVDAGWSGLLAGTIDRLAPLLRRGLSDTYATLLDPADVAATAKEVAGRVGKGRVSLTIDPVAVQLDVVLEPAGPAALEELKALATVSPAELLALPADSVAALSFVETAKARGRRAAERARSLVAMVPVKKGEKGLDAAELAAVLGDIAAGRGDRTLIAGRCSGVGVTGLARGDVSDQARLRQALRRLAALRKHPAAARLLEERKLRVSTKVGRQARVVGEVVLLRIERAAAQKQDKPEPIDLRYVIGDTRFAVAAGMDTVDSIVALLHPDKERSLAASPALARAIGSLGSSAWLALMVDPQAINACVAGKPGGELRLPVALSLGLADGKVRGKLWFPASLLTVLARDLR